MKRGEIWTLQADGYASKPRPVVIVQSDAVDRFDSVITCLLTSYDSSDIDTRVRLEPSPENGLNKVSYVMTDKIVTVDRNWDTKSAWLMMQPWRISAVSSCGF